MMENFFRKYGWTLRLGTIALAMLLLASMVNAGVSNLLAPYTVPPVQDLTAGASKGSKGPVRRNARKKPSKDRVLSISKRCLFGCKEEENKAPTCPAEGCPEGQECKEGVCLPVEAQSPAIAGDAPVPSDLALKLIGAMVSKPSEYSTAMLNDASKQTYVVSIGEALMGEHELVEVRRDRVIFKRNGRLEYIKLEGALTGDPRGTRRPTTAAISPALSAPPRKKTAKSKSPLKIGNDGVKAVSTNEFTVARDMISSRIKDKKALAKGATIVPNYKKGKKNGLKLIGVKSNSIYKSLGLKSGDVLQSVNGTTIKSQSHALGLMEKFEDASKVNIVIERGGVRKTLRYNVK